MHDLSREAAVDPGVVDAIVEGHGRDPSAAVAILQAIQARYHYLPQTALERVCETTEISPATLVELASFYAQLRLEPAGRHRVKVCVGTACHVMGAEAVVDGFHRHLAIPQGGDTDPERVFTVERVACLGCCSLAPAVQVDDVTYGFLGPDTVPEVLADFLASRDAAAVGPGATGALPVRAEVRLCLCSSCSAAGAGRVHDELRRQIAALGLPVGLKTVGCLGMAYQAPLVEVDPGGGRVFRYGRVCPHDVRAMLLEHLRPARFRRRIAVALTRALERLVVEEAREPVTRFAVDVRDGPDATFVGPQVRLATEHAGEVDPLDLDGYVARGGLEALTMCRAPFGVEEVLTELEASGLRGRGGAGFPTATKWAAVRAATTTPRYVVCNGDEGDPGAFMDRLVLESFPFRVLEGLLIAARVVGAERGFLYIRAEYPLAVERVRAAVAVLEERGVVGAGGSGPSLQVVTGAGAFVCGEETALLAAIEGRRPIPSVRPPYPAERGLWGCPTLVNNVETYAVVPGLIRRGGASFARLGTPTSPGSKCFALAGKIARGGLIEVPMGVTLRTIVEEIGGGVRGGRLKAVQIGGPSGGCVPASLADTPVDYEALTGVGAMMGSGGLVVLDQDDCMVDVARYFMAFTQAESCGRCTFCRVGTRRMLEILERLCAGDGRQGDLEALEELGRAVQDGSRCGLGRTAPNPVLSTLTHFRDEYEAHLAGSCPAGRCRALVTFSIGDGCIGCSRCAQRCPTGAIALTPYERHVIDADRCSRCGTCRAACPVGAVEVR